MSSWGEKLRAKMNGKGKENVIKKKCCKKENLLSLQELEIFYMIYPGQLPKAGQRDLFKTCLMIPP